MIGCLVISVVALTVAVASWLRPVGSNQNVSPSSEPVSETEIAHSRDALCEAHNLIAQATRTAASRTSDNQATKSVIATNVRLATIASGQYLLQKISEYPNAPAELSDALTTLATAYQKTTLLHIADATEAELDVAYGALDEADAKVQQECR